MQNSVLNSFYYNQLSPEEKTAYKAIKAGTTSFEKKVIIPKLSESSVERTFLAVLYDNPLIYYVVREKYNWLVYNDHIEFNIEYTCSQKDIKKFNDIIAEKMKTAIELCRGKTSYEKELLIHDWLCNNVSYNKTPPHKKYIHNVVGALVYGECVCDGFSAAFKTLMNALRIECMIVSGTAITEKDGDEEGHAWNIINIDGKYYHTDVTFDRLNHNEFCSRSYLNLSDSQIYVDHKPKPLFNYPKCSFSRCPVKILKTKQEIFGFLSNECNKKAEYSEFKLERQFEYQVFKKHFEASVTNKDKWFYQIKSYVYGDYSDSIIIIWKNK